MRIGEERVWVVVVVVVVVEGRSGCHNEHAHFRGDAGVIDRPWCGPHSGGGSGGGGGGVSIEAEGEFVDGGSSGSSSGRGGSCCPICKGSTRI